MTLLLVMLHTGTMFAVIAYFWKTWKAAYFSSRDAVQRFAIRVIWATALTGIVGEAIKKVIEKILFHNAGKDEIEQLFSHLELVAPALAAAGVLILIAGLLEKRLSSPVAKIFGRVEGSVTMGQAGWMGIVQGLALPFRGFSRSGSTISTGMLVGATKERAERFQLRDGGRAHSGGGRHRGSASRKGRARGRGHWHAHRPQGLARHRPARHGLLLRRRFGRTEMAQQLGSKAAGGTYSEFTACLASGVVFYLYTRGF